MIMATVADLPLGRSWVMSAYEARRCRKNFGMSDEAGRDRCTALWKTYSVKRSTEEDEETEFEEDRKRGSSVDYSFVCLFVCLLL